MRPSSINPAALTVVEAAALLHIPSDLVRYHVAAGLPTDAQGRIHLVEYVAWMSLRLRNENRDNALCDQIAQRNGLPPGTD